MLPPKWPDIPLMEGNDTLELNPDQTTLTRKYTERVISFIEKNKEGPFFCYLPYAMPHVPLFPGEAFQGQSSRGVYGDVVEEIDWSVGAIMEAMRRSSGHRLKPWGLMSSSPSMLLIMMPVPGIT